ncbi:hypothetical protein BDN70DRAFT_927131 [Pholiota conissans]|uniref:Association with the SNF1 complex (ASC) domain-containing protein n=1 Tax=Pholiota conissans TaxID=109636 RepID=A0A9P5ZE43_9AGAR|nr:hypothetical protein BDN70DRAFT_927131 [Pholiota conissans]
MGNSASSPATNRPPPSQAQQALLLAAQGQSTAQPPSTAQSTTTPTRVRTPSISPGPGNPHRSLRTKKRSLELPDLASLSLTPAASPYTAAAIAGRQQAPTKTQSIPIPVSPQANNPFNHYQAANELEPVQRATVILPSTTDMRREYASTMYQPPPSTHQPFPPAPRRGHRAERQDRERQDRQERQERQDRQDREKQERQDRLAREQYNRDAQQQARYSEGTHRATQAPPAYPRGRQQAPSSRQQAAHVQRIQALYDSSLEPPAPPSSPAEPSHAQQRQRRQEVVRSSIPILLGKKTIPPPPVEEVKSTLVEEPIFEAVPIKITWKGGGDEVVLARAGDDEWKGRQPMQREGPDSNVWSVTVDLLPGTHHVRFLVDDIWRVADDLPAAVDDQGSLANYVAVPFTTTIAAVTGTATPDVLPTPVIPPAAPPALVLPPPPIKRIVPGQSFWSAESSADGDDDDLTSPRPPKIDIKNHPHASPAAVAYIQATWTDVFPPELIEAAKEEEAYLNASAGQYDGHGQTRVTGFVPAPNIPPAPGLPRHLEKLILNSKVGEQKTAPASNTSNAGSSPRRGGKKDSAALAGGVGSGQAQAKRERRGERDREDRDRRDRENRGDRERTTRSRRGNLPPAPPPSETGDDDVYEESYSAAAALAATQSPYMPANLLKGYAGQMNTGAAIQASLAASSGGQSSSLPTGSSAGGYAGGVPTSSSGGALATNGSGGASGATSTAASGTTTPQPSGSNGSATPTGQMSPHQTPPKGVPQWGVIQSRTSGGGAGTTSPPITRREQAAGGGASSSFSTTTPNGIAANGNPNGNGYATAPYASQGFAGPGFGLVAGYTAPSAMERTALSGSRAITLDDANMPPLTDDNSVLPVPSHVVLHHLCTSAIRNGVLAVANTTRYRKKYLTIIYYKPT